jgi:flagellin-like protein
MNKTLRKFGKNAKALSPVVASIILIAVTVAVSVVVAAWMGGMSIGLMGGAEQVSITNVEFVAGTPNTVIVSVKNGGGADAELVKTYVNSASFADPSITVMPKGDITDTTLTLDWDSNTSYDIKFTTAKGNSVGYTQVSPP